MTLFFHRGINLILVTGLKGRWSRGEFYPLPAGNTDFTRAAGKLGDRLRLFNPSSRSSRLMQAS